ncbi:MAG: hypothetical protein IKX19_08450 [Clostridia bacterium]|nr:hypothetical protein [Clostridia bacterium]
MPNHVRNIVEFSCDDETLKKILEAIQKDNDGENRDFGPGTIDFDKLIPMPPEYLNDGRWYDWRWDHWGTKWNSYDNCYNEDRRIEFLTAWSPPHEIMEELARRFPEAGFLHRWADEDIGSNVGQREYEHGECVEIYEPSDQKECIDLACEVWGDDPLDLGFMLNRSGTGYCQVDWEEYDVIELLDRRMLFTDCRLSPDDIPVGLYAYDLRHTDDGARFGSIEPRVIVNHGGVVLTDEPIDFGDKGFIELTEDTDPNFLGYKGTMGQLLRDELDLPESDLRTEDKPNQTEGMTLA